MEDKPNAQPLPNPQDVSGDTTDHTARDGGSRTRHSSRQVSSMHKSSRTVSHVLHGSHSREQIRATHDASAPGGGGSGPSSRRCSKRQSQNLALRKRSCHPSLCANPGSHKTSTASDRQEEYDQFGRRVHHSKMENTYRTAPNESEMFRPSDVRALMNQHLQCYLKDVIYSEGDCQSMAKKLVTVIKRDVRALPISHRYKVVCFVTLGEDRDQGVEFASRCLWDTHTDNWACATFRNRNLYAVASVYALYFE